MRGGRFSRLQLADFRADTEGAEPSQPTKVHKQHPYGEIRDGMALEQCEDTQEHVITSPLYRGK